MKTNEGTPDRILRIVIGLALMIGAFLGVFGPWAWIGVVGLVTGFVGWCPVYSLLGIDTCAVGRH